MKAIRALKIVLKDTVMSRERAYLEECIKELEYDIFDGMDKVNNQMVLNQTIEKLEEQIERQKSQISQLKQEKHKLRQEKALLN